MNYTLITGGGAGIGKALAEECAARKMNILIVALPGKELEDTVDEIKKKYGVAIHSLGIELTAPGAFCQVQEWVKKNNFHINILINNVGAGSQGEFRNAKACFYEKQLVLNIEAATILTKLLLDNLKANAPSHILNLGSMGGFYIIPGKAVYAASKAYIYFFSRALRMELKQHNISVSVLCPGGTDSNENTIAMNKDLKGIARLSILKPGQVAKEAIAKMLKGKEVIIPGTITKMYYIVSRMVPSFIRQAVVKKSFQHAKKYKY
jgi:short-subunit dehydrogenase